MGIALPDGLKRPKSRKLSIFETKTPFKGRESGFVPKIGQKASRKSKFFYEIVDFFTDSHGNTTRIGRHPNPTNA